MADGRRAWAIRPATRPGVGGGHVARCTALAKALEAFGPVVVISKDRMWRDHFDRAGLVMMSENEALQHVFAGIVLDDYELGPDDVTRWRQRSAGLIVQIVDFGPPLANVDFAVNAAPGLAGDRLGGVPALLGPAYAMLGAAYSGCPRFEVRSKVERVVVGLGLIDSSGMTERVLKALAGVLDPNVAVDVMLGGVSPSLKQVAAVVAARGNWRLHPDAAEPWRLLERADMAVTGAGQSLLERLAFGVPSVAIAVAANQKAALAGAAVSGAVISLGDATDATEERIASAGSALANDKLKRRAMSAAAQQLVDGKGAVRVAHHIATHVRSDLRATVP